METKFYKTIKTHFGHYPDDLGFVYDEGFKWLTVPGAKEALLARAAEIDAENRELYDHLMKLWKEYSSLIRNVKMDWRERDKKSAPLNKHLEACAPNFPSSQKAAVEDSCRWYENKVKTENAEKEKKERETKKCSSAQTRVE